MYGCYAGPEDIWNEYHRMLMSHHIEIDTKISLRNKDRYPFNMKHITHVYISKRETFLKSYTLLLRNVV